MERKVYKCRNDDKCNVRAGSYTFHTDVRLCKAPSRKRTSLEARVMCRACRYRTCVSAGMTADTIRNGGHGVTENVLTSDTAIPIEAVHQAAVPVVAVIPREVAPSTSLNAVSDSCVHPK